MGIHTSSKNTKCANYLSSKRRIKNKKRELLKRIKNIKPETQKIIIEKNPIGRAKEK